MPTLGHDQGKLSTPENMIEDNTPPNTTGQPQGLAAAPYSPPKRLALRIKCNPKHAHEQLKDEHGRRCFAASLSHIVSMTDNGTDMPHMPQPGDSYRWSIDRFGNDFWVQFDREDNLKFTLSCRYGGEEAETLAALANYVAHRLNCEVLGAA